MIWLVLAYLYAGCSVWIIKCERLPDDWTSLADLIATSLLWVGLPIFYIYCAIRDRNRSALLLPPDDYE